LVKGNNLFIIGRDKERLSEVTKKIRSLGGFAQYYVCDVQNENDVEMVFQDVVSKFNGLDVLFTNAGIGFFGKLEDITIEQFDCQFNTNVRGVFLFLKKFIPLFKSQNRGQIVVTSSNLGLKTSGEASIYSAT
jgi:NADP-dependent 3-hydroxy acid dehydrogenase YdfG